MAGLAIQFTPAEPAAVPLLADLLSDFVARADVERMSGKAREHGLPPQRLLFAQGYITPERYARVLAVYFDTAFIHAGQHPRSDYILINASTPLLSEVAMAIAQARRHGRPVALFAAAGDRCVEPGEGLAKASVTEAVDALRREQPSASAGRRMWLWQYIVSSLIAGGAIGVIVASPTTAGIVLLVFSATAFAFIAAFRLLVFFAALLPARRVYASPKRLLSDEVLPSYAVLVPLFKEAAILPDLVEALSAINYPHAKLDIILILEESDKSTRRRAGELALPPYMRTVVVPDRQPRTKPKALNMALALSRAELVAVFDAEDIPAPDQLRIAASVFARRNKSHVCLQARLAIYNPRQSWLTRQFTVEYATLFHAFLPALSRLGVPLPLSGTSNHFRRHVLEEGAWDPFNVTEDADLGIRLTRMGGSIALIDSDTHEEAPVTFASWLPQRTRWIKGWMQTYLVHTRQPWRLCRELGLWRTISFHALFGGFLLSVLAYPWLFVLLTIELSQPAPFAGPQASFYALALTVALVDLAVGIGAAVLTCAIGLNRAGLGYLMANVAIAPVYWMAISIAGYRALIQLILRPHIWEKTTHSARRAHRRVHPAVKAGTKHLHQMD